MMNMAYGKDGMSLTESFEQCRLVPYQDSAGVWTDGWGNTKCVMPGMAITQEQADADLLANVAEAVNCVNDCVTVPLTQDQFDALVDFTFNAGIGAFKGSTLLVKLNQGDYAGAEAEMAKWDKITVNGKLVPCRGLDNRRQAEQSLFEKVAT